MEGVQTWISKHKLGTIGGIWTAVVGGSFVVNNQPAHKTTLRLIHARMHAQAITLIVLSGASIYHHFYDHHPALSASASASATRP
ncbi:hypothetical protein LINGRAHAP2_LOCUS6907 [Linum grandiflorum]